jgi:hypothetical protein
MKPVLIVENSTDSLIRESVGSKDYILNGTFTEFGVKIVMSEFIMHQILTGLRRIK